ncbi:vacuolar membrane protein-domain-containing protein [Usnea florida]
MLFSSTLSYITPSAVAHFTSTPTSIKITSINVTFSGESRPGAENGECKLLGPFALFIQGALGVLALLVLVFKRWRERPQRPLKIWAFDASKQVVGSALLHISNLLLSMLSSGQLTIKAGDYQANPCSFYLLNLAIDTTIGIPILVVFLNLLTHGFSLTPLGNPPESIESGNYGRPPKTKWWLKQSFIYFLGLLGMKACVFFIFQICPWIIRVGDWALRWTEGNEMVQVFFVMLFFPVVMNALQYYIIDSFIKNQKPSDHDPNPDEDGDDTSIDESGRTRRWYCRGEEPNGANDGDAGHATSKDGAEIKVSEGKDKPKLRVEATKLDEYDPAIDGEGSGDSGEPDNPPDPSQGAIARSQRNHAKDS